MTRVLFGLRLTLLIGAASVAAGGFVGIALGLLAAFYRRLDGPVMRGVDVATGTITFETLKKRQRGLFRTVPVPPELATMLDLVFGLRGLRGPAAKAPLWNWSRATAWRRVKEVLAAAGIEGAQASPKGLRHAMGVAAVGQGIPLNLVQRWMGYAQLTTTAIYAEAVGEEERSIAARMWR